LVVFDGGFALFGDVVDVCLHQAEVRFCVVGDYAEGVVEVADRVNAFVNFTHDVGHAERGLKVIYIQLQALFICLD